MSKNKMSDTIKLSYITILRKGKLVFKIPKNYGCCETCDFLKQYLVKK